MMPRRDDVEIWARLVSGRALDDLGLPTVGGRLDIRGLEAPEPAALQRYTTAGGDVSRHGDLVVIRRQRWAGLDLSGARMGALRFFESTIENCSLDGASCQDWRMWGTTVADTSFRKASLRESALGGVDGQRRNTFKRVLFDKTDLRQTAWTSADMVECRFENAKLRGVDFQGTVFVDCVFIGALEDTLFYRHGLRGEAFPPNEMQNVDFRHASLRLVAFRRLDMKTVRWPDGDDHVIVRNYPSVLERVLELLKDRTDEQSRGMTGLLADYRKWVGPNQTTGVLNKRDLVEIGGQRLVGEILPHLIAS